jgi:phage replication initiation protein
MTERIVIVDGQPKVVPVATPAVGEVAHIDFLSFTLHESALYIGGEQRLDKLMEAVRVRCQFGIPVGDNDLTKLAVETFRCMVGRDVAVQEGNWQLGFRVSMKMESIGLVAVGGAGERVFFKFSGQAFSLCADLPVRLHQWLSDKHSLNITRVDVAVDDFAGEVFSPVGVKEAHEAGLFNPARGMKPRLDFAGDWSRGDPYRLGLTTYIGGRDSKLLRCYEKGKEQGDKESPWVRIEVELRGATFAIPLGVLVQPSAFFCGAWPWLASQVAKLGHSGNAVRLERLLHESECSIDGVIQTLRKQYGQHIRALRRHFGDDKALLDSIQAAHGRMPPKLAKAFGLLDEAEKEFDALRAQQGATSSCA